MLWAFKAILRTEHFFIMYIKDKTDLVLFTLADHSTVKWDIFVLAIPCINKMSLVSPWYSSMPMVDVVSSFTGKSMQIPLHIFRLIQTYLICVCKQTYDEGCSCSLSRNAR